MALEAAAESDVLLPDLGMLVDAFDCVGWQDPKALHTQSRKKTQDFSKRLG